MVATRKQRWSSSDSDRVAQHTSADGTQAGRASAAGKRRGLLRPRLQCQRFYAVTPVDGVNANLAALCGASTRVMNQAVKRNADRFPADFVFRLTADEKIKVVTDCDHFKVTGCDLEAWRRTGIGS